MSSVQIDIQLITSAFKSALADATKSTDAFAKNTKSSFSGVQHAFTTMAGVVAANALTGAFRAITGSLSSMIAEASESENAVSDLNVALKQAGLYSAASSQEMQDFAGQLQAITIYGDEAVLASANLLLSLTNLDTKGVQQATMAAANLAATLNIDLQTATEMVSKAINGNTMAFSKLGIQIQKGGTDSERLTNLLAALSTQAGAAEAKTKTYAGATAQLGNAQGELSEVLGKLYTQNAFVISSTKSLNDAYAAATSWIDKNKDTINDLIISLGITVTIVGSAVAAWMAYTAVASSAFVSTVALASAISGASAASVILTTAASAAWAAITGPIGIAVAALAVVGVAVYSIVKNWEALTAWAYNAAGAILEYAAVAANLVSSGLSESIKAQAQSFRDKAAAIKAASEATKEAAAVDDEQAKQQKAKRAAELADIQRENAQKAALQVQQNESLNLVEQERLTGLQEVETAHQEAMLNIRGQYGLSDLEARAAQQQQELLARQAHETAALKITSDAEMAKAKAISDAEERKKAIKAAADKAQLDKAKLQSKQEIEVAKQEAKSQQQIDQMKIANRKDTFATIATLQNSNNKYLATIGKAAAITQIAIDTPVAIAKAMAAFPPPANFVAAGLVGVAMAAQAAQVAGINFADGGIVPGSNYSGDRIRANLNSGEMVLNRRQQASLFALANSPTSVTADNSQTNALLVQLIDAVNSSKSIQIDGREIISVVRDGIQSGRTVA